MVGETHREGFVLTVWRKWHAKWNVGCRLCVCGWSDQLEM